MNKLVPGMKVRYLPQPEWGIGHLVQLAENGSKAMVFFPTREDPVWVSTKQGALVSQAFSKGEEVGTVKGQRATIRAEVEGGRGLRRYELLLEGGEETEYPESELRALPPKPDALAMLREGRVTDAKNFLLRRRALYLDEERRNDAMGALLASRVMVKPHQVGVVQRVLSSRRPRFILADEVGLGKTIEAGMIFSALRLAGLARRVLVVAPSHLTVQWLAELFHKFNQLFTLLDTERYAQSRKELPDQSPWSRFEKVVVSLEMLSRTDEHRLEAADPNAFWDLVIIDEAHHLKGERAFEVARALAQNSWGMLLLTATPMQLDPAEYHGLLTLIDPKTAPTLEGFKSRLARQEELSAAVRTLLEGGKVDEARSALSKRFPKDEQLGALKDKDALLAHLAETYSLSERLIRNRRAVVGGFSARRLHRHPVEVPAPELTTRNEALERLAKSNIRGAPLAGLIRRLESSPAAFFEGTSGQKDLADLKLPRRDAKLLAFLKVLQGIWAKEPRAKVLVFTESRATLDSLREELRNDGIEALAYHGELPLVERDRQVARFRDPEGPRVLICTEVGGEGRNFQFAHHLVHYDLPWSPAAVEQRIGRLDRIGQTQTVELHVFDAKGTFSSDVLALLADSVGVFGETVGGLDAVLEEVEPRLAELALLSAKERKAYAEELQKKVAAARAQTKRAYDPLLDLRSFDRPAVGALVTKARERIGLEEEEEESGGDASLEDGLWAVARDLDERLEETVAELAQKVGIGVDTDQQVEAFQCAFQFGHELKVEALPGLQLLQDKTVLGTFWRDTAVEQEEIEYFATGHSIVEGLFGFLRDGPYGRNGMRYLEKRGLGRMRGIEFLFHIVPPEPEDTSPGAKVPSRQLSRYLDRWLVHIPVKADPAGPKADVSLREMLEPEGRSLRGDEVRAAFPELPTFVEPALEVATAAAQKELERRAGAAKQSIERERDEALSRMELALTHQGVSAEVRKAALEEEQDHYETLLAALKGLKLVVDSASAFAINR